MSIQGGRGDIFSRPSVAQGPPTAEETPWRSVVYVTGTHSADGNDYHPGDPIPQIEAERQGQTELPPPDEAEPMMECPRCHGNRYFTNPRPKGHKLGCGCRFCQPCPRCEGNGYIPQAEAIAASGKQAGVSSGQEVRTA